MLLPGLSLRIGMCIIFPRRVFCCLLLLRDWCVEFWKLAFLQKITLHFIFRPKKLLGVKKDTVNHDFRNSDIIRIVLDKLCHLAIRLHLHASLQRIQVFANTNRYLYWLGWSLPYQNRKGSLKGNNPPKEFTTYLSKAPPIAFPSPPHLSWASVTITLLFKYRFSLDLYNHCFFSSEILNSSSFNNILIFQNAD